MAWVLIACALASCGKDASRGNTQVAARVNKSEVTIHQVNHALQSQRGLRPDQTEAAGGRALERLIEQQLAVQKAQALEVDRDPKVMQQLEASRQEIIARAYFDRLAEGVGKPTPEDVTSYFNDNPALFRDRRVYQLQEVSIHGKPPQLDAIRKSVEQGKPLAELLSDLRASNVAYTSNQVVRAAEQVPLGTLPTLSKLRPGQAMVVATPEGTQIVGLIESRPQAIEEVRARPAIEQFMINERKRKVVAEDVKALRAAATIEYVGKFAASAPSTGNAGTVPTAGAAAVNAGTTPAASLDAAGVSQQPVANAPLVSGNPSAPRNADSASAPSAGISTSVINKGLGLK